MPSNGLITRILPAVRRHAAPALIVAVVYTMAAVLVMWPAIHDLHDTIMGNIQPNDATAGGVWLAWQFTHLSPFASTTPSLAAPSGTAFWQSTDATALGWILPEWLFAHIVGPVGAWNLAVMLGFILDALTMFLFVRWLTRHDVVAFVAGLLYGFSPFHLEESYAHIGYVYSWIFPLILWSGLSFCRKPTVQRAALFGVVTGAAAYIDGYYIVFAPLAAGAISVVALASAVRLGRRWIHVLRNLVLVGVVYLCTLAPLAAAFYRGGGATGVSIARTQGQLEFYRVRLWEFLVPWSASPLWNGLFDGFVRSQRVHGPLESTLYLGAVVILLSTALWLALVFRRGPFKRGAGNEALQAGDEAGGFPIPPRTIAMALLAGAAVCTLASLSAIGPLPGIPVIIWHVRPYWRIYGRLFVAIDCFVIAGASMTLVLLLRDQWQLPRLSSRGQRVAVSILATLAIIDGCAILPWSTWSYAARTPLAFRWLAAHHGGIVAEYPPTPSSKWAWEWALTYQPEMDHPFFNGGLPGTTHSFLEHGLADLKDPQTVPALERLGVRYIVVMHRWYHMPPRDVLYLPGLHKLVDAGGISLYRLPTPSRSIQAARLPGIVTIHSGFNNELAHIPHMRRWMSGSLGQLGIRPLGAWKAVRFGCLLASFGHPREVTMSQNGRVLWRGLVPAGNKHVPVRFVVGRHGLITLRAEPGATFASEFWTPFSPKQYFSVDVSNLGLRR